jgi:hypothetical protein
MPPQIHSPDVRENEKAAKLGAQELARSFARLDRCIASQSFTVFA